MSGAANNNTGDAINQAAKTRGGLAIQVDGMFMFVVMTDPPPAREYIPSLDLHSAYSSARRKIDNALTNYKYRRYVTTLLYEYEYYSVFITKVTALYRDIYSHTKIVYIQGVYFFII